MLEERKIDTVVVDWREITNLGEFLETVRKSKMNKECLLIGIASDLLDLRQAFSAGVQYLIHKPASVVQIERCLRAAYCATVVRRRKQHREPVTILASVSTHAHPYAEVTMVNLSEGGAGLRLDAYPGGSAHLDVGEEADLRFVLPESNDMLHTTARVVWTATGSAGVRFSYIPDAERVLLEHWLTACVERSLTQLCERVEVVCA